MKEAVVLVHGIWMRGGSLFILARHLRKCGFASRAFTYASLRRSAAGNAEQLHAFAAGIDADIVHFVGHSLGGIVILHLFDRYPQQRPGRVVLLGAPVRGSSAARRVAGYPWGRLVFGHSLGRALGGGTPAWGGARALGVIAGSRPLGIGRVFSTLRGPNDGTVAVSETQLPGATDSIVLPVSHTGLVASGPVARQVCAFLRGGSFER